MRYFKLFLYCLIICSDLTEQNYNMISVQLESEHVSSVPEVIFPNYFPHLHSSCISESKVEAVPPSITTIPCVKGSMRMILSRGVVGLSLFSVFFLLLYIYYFF
jgi:hypothetical protein